MTHLEAQPITQEAFAPFGEVIATCGAVPDRTINQGQCERFHDLAALDFADGRAGLSLFRSRAFEPPFRLTLVERHPLGSQAFLPLDGTPCLLAVAGDRDGVPEGLRAFVVAGHQGVNIHRGVWHGVLTPIGSDTGLYAVIDRIGPGANLQEHWFDPPPEITLPAPAKG